MAVYELRELVSIREVRENRAAQVVAAKTKALDQCVQNAQQCRVELEEYRAWKKDERERVYKEVLSKLVSLNDLEQVREVLAALEEKESLIEKKIILADKAVIEAQEALDASRDAWRKCLNNLRKLEEHREVWMAEAKIEEERAEEKEAEELRVVGIGAAGWDGNEY